MAEPVIYYTCSLCHGKGWIAYGDQNPTECPKCEEAAEKYERLKNQSPPPPSQGE